MHLKNCLFSTALVLAASSAFAEASEPAGPDMVGVWLLDAERTKANLAAAGHAEKDIKGALLMIEGSAVVFEDDAKSVRFVMEDSEVSAKCDWEFGDEGAIVISDCVNDKGELYEASDLPELSLIGPDTISVSYDGVQIVYTHIKVETPTPTSN